MRHVAGGNMTGEVGLPPQLLRGKDHTQPSVFRPEHLLREARRQKGLPDRDVPAVCVLDPDGDLFRHARIGGRASLSPGWACYHTEVYELPLADGSVVGVLGNAVGAPFAVLVAEQLFASGCRFLISITSAGKVADLGDPPYVVLIDRALRDEGTSFHYLPPGADDFVAAPDADLLSRIEAAVRAEFPPGSGTAVHRGSTWTTDAPYRETAAAIAAAASRGILAVEMEAAALYAFATARGFAVMCFAHVTNSMGQSVGGDFEKGEAEGTVTGLRLIGAAAKAFDADLPRPNGKGRAA
jgi:uridine phosphorylase